MSEPELTPVAVQEQKAPPRSEVGTAGIAVALLGGIVLIDAAIETFMVGAGVRWWTIGVAAMYAVVTIGTFRAKISWRTRLTIALVAILGLLAATAWLPDGLTNGLRLIGQPTPRVLAGLAACALVIAFVAVMRATGLPLAARAIAALVAVYGLAAFALGMWQSTQFTALFSGGSLWQALPRVLQGAVLGGVVVLPAALVVSLLGGLARGRRTWQPQVIVVLGLSLAVVVSGFMNAAAVGSGGVRLDLSGTGVNASDRPTDAPPVPDQQTSADAVALLEKVAATPEPSTFSVERAAAGIGDDPAALLAYVREHVRTQIYSGVLRGARGTLMGGAGNAWDQALLLAAMLRVHGRHVRFVRAHVAPEMAERIVDRMFTDAGRPRTPAGRTPQIPESLQKASRATLARIQAAWQRAQVDLLQAVDRAQLPLGAGTTSRQALESEAADHLFVEYQDGDRWVSLDPVATVDPGASAASAGEVLSEIPDASYHHVTIRVVVEERRAQQLERKEVFRYRTTAAALNGERVLLTNRFDHDIAGRWRATPVLQVDGHAYAARTFTEAGPVAGNANSKEDLIGQAHQSMTQLGRVTELFGDPKAASTAPAAGEFTAELLEIDFTDPAGHSEVVQRELVDRIGAVARAARTAVSVPLTPITVADDIPLQLAGLYACAFASGPLDPELPVRRLSSTVAAAGDLRALEDVRPTPGGSLSSVDSSRLTRALDQYPALLQASAESVVVVSQRLAQRLRIGSASPLFYEATPRLVIASFDLTSGLALDLRRNMVRALGRAGSGSEIARANLARSVADAAIEGTLLMPAVPPRRITAVDIFERARREGLRLVAIRAGAPLTSVQPSDLARARMANAAAGTLMIAPERTPSADRSHFAWWQLDPSTGEAISVLDTGLYGAQEIPEYAETNVISPMAYEVPPPNAGPISPLACEVARPWAQCVIFSDEMLLELMKALIATGGG